MDWVRFNIEHILNDPESKGLRVLSANVILLSTYRLHIMVCIIVRV